MWKELRCLEQGIFIRNKKSGGGQMTQSELIARLMDRLPGYSPQEVETLLKSMFEGIAHALEAGQRVELRGFGSFFVKHREPRVGCDPRTGANIRLDHRYLPFFRPGKILLDAVN